MKIRISILAGFAGAVLALCITAAETRSPLNRTSGNHTDTVGIQIQNVNLLFLPDVILGVRSLRGELRATRPGIAVTFDNSDSFIVSADSGDVCISAASLAALMNEYVFGSPGTPFRKIEVKLENGRLVQTGTIHKGVTLAFKIEASLSVTEDGRVRVHADHIQADHLPVKGLLHFLGEDLEKLIHENPGRGVQAQGDDLILSPSALTPPPHIQGRVTHVSVAGDVLELTFDSGRRPAPLKPPFQTDAYIYHRGGVLRFGKLTMNDADLEIVGDRPGEFTFFQKEYKKQLVAGYSKNTPGNGLVAHMADYSHFQSQPASRKPAGF